MKLLTRLQRRRDLVEQLTGPPANEICDTDSKSTSSCKDETRRQATESNSDKAEREPNEHHDEQFILDIFFDQGHLCSPLQ